MFIPIPVLIILALLAAPTILLIVLGVNDAARARGLTFLGLREEYREDGTRIERWCLLYVPLIVRRGWHSTALL